MDDSNVAIADPQNTTVDSDNIGSDISSEPPPYSPSREDQGTDSDARPSGDAIRLQQQLGLYNGISLIVGCIIGSGIFLSPKSVLENAGSVGMSMVVWVVSGVFSLIGALCFAELGTTILASGGEYSYILFAFGELPAFVLLWATLIIINPTGQAIIALTFANYVMQPFVGDCENPSAGVVQIVAILCLGKIF